MKSLVIFDLDGTLINSIFDLADAVNDSLIEFGYPTHDVSQYYYFVGNGTLKLCERALPQDKRSEQDIQRLHTAFSKKYDDYCLNKTKPYDGVLQVLDVIKSKGIKCAVASNKTDEFVSYIVSSIFPKNTFDLVVGKKEGVPTKPNPQILHNIIDDMGFEKDDCIMVGDSDVDVITAHNEGIKCVGCAWGFRGEEELSCAGADYIAFEPKDILNYL